jgi:hypothetical protein
MRAHDERNLWLGEPDLSCWLHRTADQHWLTFHACWSLRPLCSFCYSAPNICSSLPCPMAMQLAWQRCDLRCRCGSKKLSAEATNSPKKKAPAVGAGGRARPGPKFAERIEHRPLRSACGRDVGGGESHLLSATSSGRYRLVALTPFRGFVRLRQRFVR